MNGDAVHRGEMSAVARATSFAYGIAHNIALDTSSDRREIDRLNQDSKRGSIEGRCGMSVSESQTLTPRCIGELTKTGRPKASARSSASRS